MTGERAIFVTGGASGIGRAVARLFAERGWRVGLADIDAAGLAETKAMLPPGSASLHVMDVRVRADWAAALADFTGRNAGRLDVLFNNAGIAVGGRLADNADEDIDRIVAVNLVGVVNGARAAYPYLKATPGAVLVNTASAAAIHGIAGMSLYAAVKFGVRGFSEALDGEWAADGIRVRVVMPGFIDTPLLDTVVAGTGETVRAVVRSAGLEFTALDAAALAIWDGIGRDRMHILIGPSARRLALAARWMPGILRRKLRSRLG